MAPRAVARLVVADLAAPMMMKVGSWERYSAAMWSCRPCRLRLI